jgi:uncharacterized protein YqgV (UPF0045/DUF77 family)
MQNLQKLIEEIKEQKKFAADTLEDATPQTINARMGRKRSAISRLEDLYLQYRNLIRSKVFVIAAIGDQVDEFEKLSTEISGLQSLDSDAFYHHLISKMDEKIFTSGLQNAYIIDVLSRILEEVAVEIGIQSYNQIIFNQKYDGKISSKEEALNLIKKVIEEQVGEEIASIFIIDNVVKFVFEHDLESKVHPVLVKVSNEKNLQSLLSGLKILGNSSIVVNAGKSSVSGDIKIDEVNDKTVLEALKKIKKKIK